MKHNYDEMQLYFNAGPCSWMHDSSKQLWYSSFLTSCSRVLNCKWMPIFSSTLLKLTCLITQLVCSSLYLIVTGLLTYAQSLTQAACIVNILRVLIGHYVFTWVHRMHYLSSSNFPVPTGIGNHTCKGSVLIPLVMTNFYYLYPNSIY